MQTRMLLSVWGMAIGGTAGQLVEGLEVSAVWGSLASSPEECVWIVLSVTMTWEPGQHELLSLKF